MGQELLLLDNFREGLHNVLVRAELMTFSNFILKIRENYVSIF